MLLTAYDSTGHDIFAHTSSSSCSEDHAGVEGTRAHEPPLSTTHGEAPGADGKLSASIQHSDEEGEGRPESPSSSLDEGLSQMLILPRQQRRSERIPARQHLPGLASERPHPHRSSIAHFLEQVAGGSDIDPELAREQVGCPLRCLERCCAVARLNKAVL